MENTFEQAFGWYAVINRLCDDDITKHPTILKTTIMEALNQLLYILEKEKDHETCSTIINKQSFYKRLKISKNLRLCV
jgi:hypothetical protein